MASVNRAIIIGNLGNDPELRYTQNQNAVATLNIATTDYRNDANGERQEITEWHRVVVWGRQAENCSKYLAKGRSVYVEGRIQTRSWDDQSGQKRYTTEIIAQNIQFLGGRDNAAGVSQGATRGSSAPPQQHYPQDDHGSFGSTSAPAIDEIPF